MLTQYMPALAFLVGALFAMVASCMAVTRGAQLQQEILKRGIAAQGRVLRIWRPPLFGAFTRVYFEFQPADSADAVRGCHIDRRSAAELMASLPAVGAWVNVRYLPEQPSRAVIAKLVTRFKH
jgi:hypothetical protein